MAKVALTNGRLLRGRTLAFRATFVVFCIKKKTPNAEHRTPNIELKMSLEPSEFEIGCWALSVGRFL
jgi:hypothetical protein